MYKPTWTKPMIALAIINWFAYIINIAGKHTNNSWIFVVSILLCLFSLIGLIVSHVLNVKKNNGANKVTFWLGILSLINLDIIILFAPLSKCMLLLLMIENSILFGACIFYDIWKTEKVERRTRIKICATEEGYTALLYLFNIAAIGVIYFSLYVTL